MHPRPGLRVQGGGLLYQSRGRVGAFRERVQRSKQDNVFDESILLSDRVQFLLPALAALVNDVVTNSLSFTCAQLNTEFKIAAEALKLDSLGATLYGNRHEGASELLLRGTPITEIKARGRWIAAQVHKVITASRSTLRQLRGTPAAQCSALLKDAVATQRPTPVSLLR